MNGLKHMGVARKELVSPVYAIISTTIVALELLEMVGCERNMHGTSLSV